MRHTNFMFPGSMFYRALKFIHRALLNYEKDGCLSRGQCYLGAWIRSISTVKEGEAHVLAFADFFNRRAGKYLTPSKTFGPSGKGSEGIHVISYAATTPNTK